MCIYMYMLHVRQIETNVALISTVYVLLYVHLFFPLCAPHCDGRTQYTLFKAQRSLLFVV